MIVLAVLCAPRLEAQGGFTTVTGTITDPNGLKYSCGTITAQLITAGGAAPTLNGGGFTTQTSPIGLGCPTTPGSGASGSFLMRLADSGVIVPSTTTWRFTINLAPGIPPPAGTGPQSFSVTTAINCGTNTPATCTSNAMDISTLLSASAPAISNASSGGVTLGSLDGAVYAKNDYGIIGGFQAMDCTTTSGQNTVPCTNTTFTSAMIGWLVDGVTALNGVYSFPLNAGAENTITGCSPSCPSKTAIISSNASQTGAVTLSVGPDMTSSLTTMFTTEWNNPTVNPNCRPIVLTHSIIMTKKGQATFTHTCKSSPFKGGGEAEAALVGYGGVNARFHPTQDFDYTTGVGNSCGGADDLATNTSCFESATNAVRWIHTGIDGGGIGSVGGKAVRATVLGNDSSMLGFVCSGWGGIDASMTGVGISNGAQPIIYSQLDGCGHVGLTNNDPNPAFFTNGFIGDSIAAIINNGTLSTSGNGLACATANCTIVTNSVGDTWTSSADSCGTNATNIVGVSNSGTATISGLNCSVGGTASSGAIVNQNAGKLFIGGSILKTTSGFGLTIANTSQANSFGGNTIAGVQVLNATAGFLSQNDVITGTNQAALVSGNIALTSGYGTSTVGTISGNQQRAQFTITAAGAPTSPQTLTITFPTSFANGPFCTLTDVGGTNAFPTSIANNPIPTPTTATFVITGTLTAGNTEILQLNCGTP